MVREDIKYFVVQLESLVSRAFFSSQSRFSDLVIDFLWSRIYAAGGKFGLRVGKIETDIHSASLTSEFPRMPPKDGTYFCSMRSDALTETFQKIESIFREDFENYLGAGYIMEKPYIYRTFSFPSQFHGFDIFSNVWHVDSHDGNRLLKIFLLLDKVDEVGGPLTILNEDQSQNVWRFARDRWGFHNKKQPREWEGSDRLTGDSGSFLIADTTRCLHRAGVPSPKSGYRDMAVVTIYPKWRSHKAVV